jgi:hypothetical protein
MRVIAAIIVALIAALLPATAQSQASAPNIPEEQKTVQVVLYPAAEPRPALKYQLLPPLLERRSGNAAVWWNRIPAEQNWLFDKIFAEEGPWWRFEKWMEIPIGDPREKAFREKKLADDIGLIRSGQIFSDMERAASFESCDWEQPIREGNFIAMLLPEIQGSRNYARLLSVKAHLEIAEGRYADAVRTLRTGYAEARHVAQSQTLVSGLVGVAIAGIMSNQVQQFVQQPDSPNLYWALSTLPRPLIDFRPGAEAESNLLYLQFPELRDLDSKKLSPEEWHALLIKFLRTVHDSLAVWQYGTSARDKTSWDAYSAMIALATVSGYPRAKQYLIERGRTAAEVEAMPVAQVVLLYTAKIYDEYSDDQFKWFMLPFTETGERFEQAEKRLRKAFDANREIIAVARLLLPASMAAKQAETRSEWTLAMLRIFEAMRLYAAEHDGQWPDRLSDITDVPIPTNPFDGKSFVYQRQGNKAILTCEHGPRGMPWRHEITLMPKAK